MAAQAQLAYMCGNAFEALVGAIYLDRGYATCKFFMEERIIKPYLNLEKLSLSGSLKLAADEPSGN